MFPLVMFDFDFHLLSSPLFFPISFQQLIDTNTGDINRSTEVQPLGHKIDIQMIQNMLFKKNKLWLKWKY